MNSLPLEPRLSLDSAYFLVSHGSRDPRPQVAMEQLAHLVAQELRQSGQFRGDSRHTFSPQFVEAGAGISGLRGGVAVSPMRSSSSGAPCVGIGCLELAPMPLHQQLEQFSQRAIASGYQRIQVIPVFLLPGVHVMEDIPAEVAIATQKLPPNLTIQLCPFLGSHPQISTLFQPVLNHFYAAPSGKTARILVSHGSKRPGGNDPVINLADQLNAKTAYWSVPPSLETQIQTLVQKGIKRIQVIPYFLFPGSITDAIAQAVIHLSHQFLDVVVDLIPPVGPHPTLAKFILDLAQ